MATPSGQPAKNMITSLNDNDIVLGRGIGPHHYVGNERFKCLVDNRRAEYTATKSYKTKKHIGKQVFDEIKAKGGRFLKIADSSGVWVEVEEAEALEKCKQSLREKKLPKSQPMSKPMEPRTSVENNKRRSSSPDPPLVPPSPLSRDCTIPLSIDCVERAPIMSNGLATSSSSSDTITPTNAVSQQPLNATRTLPITTATEELLRNMLMESAAAAVDPRLLLFRTAPSFAFQQQQLAGANTSCHQSRAVKPQEDTAQTTQQQQPHEALLRHFMQSAVLPPPAASNQSQDVLLSQQRRAASFDSPPETVPCHSAAATNKQTSRMQEAVEVSADNSDSSMTGGGGGGGGGDGLQNEDGLADLLLSTACALDDYSSYEEVLLTKDEREEGGDDDFTSFLKFTLGYSDDRIFTKEQEEMEQATLTDEERAAALSDMFGKLCLMSGHQRKKAKRDLDAMTISFLLRLMRLEIDRMSHEKKTALLEAQAKSRAQEFSDARLEQFLRFEGMNAELAAQRFANYWECRREIFGPEKYLLPLTLSEALGDDLTALQTGTYQLLPHPDLSGRRLLYYVPCRNTREGYDTDSMIRVIWYYLEIIWQESTGGFNCVIWDKNSTIFDVDRKLNERTFYLYRYCWPVKPMATHVCCPPKIMARFLKPVAMALMSKEARARVQFHDVPEGQIHEVLSGFGILKMHLPVEMGGEIMLNQSEWIDNRRALEMEEI